jgi:protein-tyrosine phosphatase
MDWITEHVAVGNYLEAQDTELLRRHGFRSVLSLDGSLVAERAAELGLSEIVALRLIDGSGNDPRVFRSAIEALVRLAGSLPPVLVHCHAGRSRAPAVVAGYLMQVRGIEPDAAIGLVAEKRAVSITVALELMLYGFEG